MPKIRKIDRLVSILYFPTSSQLISGHVEIEFKGTVYNLTEVEGKLDAVDQLGHTLTFFEFNPEKAMAPLEKMITHAYRGGSPFYRFVIEQTPEIIERLKNDIWKNRSLSCSYGAVSALANAGGYRVPPFFRILPSLTNVYLTFAEAFGDRRIKKVETYGHPCCLSIGAICEAFYVVGSVAVMISVCLYALQLKSEHV